jgi:uncharacterized repeat protein (TIGR02543 family)
MLKYLLRIMLLLTVLCGGWLNGVEAQAATTTLPKTGQAGCWDVSGNPVVCATDPLAKGQDGKLQKGADWPVPRLIDNGNGTVTDDLTGLVWLKDAGCFTMVGGIAKGTDAATSNLSWPNALTWSNNLKNGDCTLADGSIAGDWHLPSIKELQSLTDMQNANPALPTGYTFTGIQSSWSWFWSSSTCVGRQIDAWFVDMSNGDVLIAGFGDGFKGSSLYVWPVRGGQFGDSVVSALPASKNFGNVAVSASQNQTITISNSGATSRMHINAMVLFGTDAGQFALNVGNGTAGTCGSKTPIIPSGGSCTVSATFTPGSTGAKTASLRISGSDVNTPNVDIPLSGTGVLTYTVTYNGNGSTSGTVPVDGSSPYVSGATVTVLGNTGTLAKTGYTFFGWNTAANGSGTNYAPADTFAIAANTTLYAKWTAAVTYSGNGNTGGTVPTDVSNYLAGDTITVPGNTGTLTKTGYTFAGWNTAANGSGTTYAPAATFAAAGDITLYAKWCYNVTYDGNGNSSGAAPADNNKYLPGATVTVLGNTGTLAKTGYIFGGWNSAADGSGTTYAPAVTFAIAGNTALYAKWIYNVTYSGNGNNGGAVPTDNNKYLPGDTVTVLGNTGTLTKTGYTFAGWNSAANGSGTSYAPAATFVIAGNTVLYAKWTATVTYNSNGSSSGSVPTDAGAYLPGATVTVLGNTGTLTKTGYTFAGWNTAANGSGTTYSPAATFAIAGNTVLYAKWTAAVTYNSNGSSSGSVPTDAGAYLPGATVSVLGNSGTLAKTGFTFGGWNTAADGSGITYTAATTFAIAGNTTLYAKWGYTVTYNGNGYDGGTAPIDSNVYLAGATVTTLGSGSLSKSGYSFAGWNSAPNGSGTSYNQSTTFAIAGNSTLYAQWSPLPTYGVTYNGNGNSGGTVPYSGFSYLYGDTVPVALNTGALTKTGYTFAGWNSAANGSGTNYAAGGTFGITGDITLYTKWNINSYNVTFTSNGGSTVTSQSVIYNTAATTPAAPAKPGYTFVGWYFDAALTTAFTFAALITTDTTLYAKWNINSYSVTFTSNGGSIVASQSVIYNTAATTPATPTKPGYTFVGWYSDAALTTAFTFATLITADTTLYAKWTTNNYSVSFNSNGGSAVASQSVVYNTNSAEPAVPTKPGYTFVGWYSDAALITTFTFVTPITADTTLYAKWTINSYNVTFNSNGGSAVTSQTVVYNTAAAEPAAPAKPGYTFAGWYSDAALTAAFTFATPITADTTLYAKWNINSYSVTFNSNGGSAVSSQSINYNTTATAPAVPTKPGYTFVGWYSDVAMTAIFNLATPITADTTLYARWTINSYSVSFNSNGGSAVISQTVVYNTATAEPAAPAKPGYTFAGWYSDTALTTSFTFATLITADTTLYAKWNINSYSVTFNSNGGSTVTSQSVVYNIAAAEPVAPTKPGYTLAGWYSDAAMIAAFTFATPIATDITLYAKWTINGYNVTFNSNGGSTVTSQTVVYNTTATAPAAPTKPGSAFAGWYSDAAMTAAFTFATPITADTTLYAKWITNGYSVTFNSNGGSAVASQSVVYNTTAAEPAAPTKPGYTFAGWYSDVATTAVFNFTTPITADTLLYAKWITNGYSVTFTSNGGSAVGSQTVAYNTTATAPVAPTKPGSAFAGWYSDAALTAAFTFATPITADTTLFAKWTINGYSVTFTSNGGSTVASQTVAYNTVAIAPVAPTKPGYTFAGWYSDAALTTVFNFSTVIAVDTTLYAKWTPVTLTYTVTPPTGTGSSVIPATAQIVNSGASISFNVKPDAGFGILAVTGCNGVLSGTTYTTGPITSDCSLSVIAVKHNGNSSNGAEPALADALKALQAYFGTVTLTQEELLRYDVAPLASSGVPQGDGVVDIADVIMILRRSAGIGSW